MRAARFANSIGESNLGLLRKPYRINYAVTLNCQSKCRMCDIWQLRPKGELALDEIRAFAQRNPHFDWVQITGGEAYMRKDVAEIAAAFEEFSHPYILTSQTNSLCETDSVVSKVRKMASLPISHFIFTLSLDGPEDVHDFQRGVDGNFKKVMALYGKLKHLEEDRRGFKVIFGYTMTKFNQGRLMDTISAIRAEYPGFSEGDIHINLAQSSGHYYGNEGMGFEPDRAAALSEVEASLARRRRAGMTDWAEGRFLSGLTSYIRTGEPPLRSKELESSLYLDSYGNVWPSIMWGLKLGAIRETGYRLGPIWNGEVAKKAREMISSGESPKFWTSCEAYSSILGHIRP